MKPAFFLALLFSLTTALSCVAQAEKQESDLVWYTDLVKAQEVSKASNKPIFGFFTGSDWCGWCHKLQADVFAKQAFKDWAKNNVVLLELDFPRRKQLAPELVQQNMGLQQAFQVRGYPTIWFFYVNTDENTKQMNISALGSVGYPQGAERGHEEVKFLSDADAVLANGKKK